MTGVTVLNQDPVKTESQVVLASASPRRRVLLELLGISFSVRAANVDEAPLAGETPEHLTTRLARSKALTVAVATSASISSTLVPNISRSPVECHRDAWTEIGAERPPRPHSVVVLAADTVVVLDDQVLGKPGDDAEAIAMLGALRGRAHRVLTGIALAVGGDIVWTSVVDTAVKMRSYGTDEVERYIRSGTHLDRAGAYGIQDTFRPVERIQGCFSNVVGLPLCEVRRALTALDSDRRWGPGWISANPEDAEPDTASSQRGPQRDCRPCDRARELFGAQADGCSQALLSPDSGSM